MASEVTPFRVPAAWQWRPSPNHNSRGLHKVTAIVLHADASSKVETSLDWIRRAESKVSYHILIGRNGLTYVCVTPDRRAWHAGTSALGAEPDCNSFAVGVCLSNRNDGVEPFPISQQGAAADVCALLCRWYGIAVSRIVTHAAVALPVGRKNDPRGLDLDAFRAMVTARLAQRDA
jgi:N-acetylmuramoyl-L-alanine amidase